MNVTNSYKMHMFPYSGYLTYTYIVCESIIVKDNLFFPPPLFPVDLKALLL